MAKKSNDLNKLFKFLKKTFFSAIPVAVGVGGLALGIRYFGDKPIISDVKKGLNGDVTGFDWFGFR